ncbi:hypothetical protein HCCG_01221 [Helicobacter cinaedi CCUG 18818 = ATCC BAA-847]|uniref:Uncharacterized protein n=1 Tax=Helicobacter cinaedi CCUG 18818 = ATCC BAA-847 TaxID=537971 RepID=A0ABN0BAT9_9HELI|nr:hypothetical protein HCCG_01221 [Helicobacter cinaedi CCUG 18818 = ATCC BAA-847]
MNLKNSLAGAYGTQNYKMLCCVPTLKRCLANLLHKSARKRWNYILKCLKVIEEVSSRLAF